MRPWPAPASVSAVDDTSGSARSPDECSDPGDRLGLLPGGLLGRLKVVGRHLDTQHALAAVAHEVERLRTDDLPGYRLPVPAALTCHNRSHLLSAPGPLLRAAGLGACHSVFTPPGIPRVRDTVVAAPLFGDRPEYLRYRWVSFEHTQTRPSEPAHCHSDENEQHTERRNHASHADQVGDHAGEEQWDRHRGVDDREDAAEDPAPR